MLLTSLLLVALFQAPVPAPPPDTPKLIVISGKTQPDLLPQYLVWREAFGVLGLMAQDGLRKELSLTEKEAALVLAAIKLTRDAEAATWQPLEAMLKDGGRRAVAAAFSDAFLRDLELQRRAILLTRTDAIVDALTGDSRNALLAWVERFRAKITVGVRESDLPFFRLPR